VSLLGRIARHPQRVGRNSAEDRLTEILSAVLDHPQCDGLAVKLVTGWLADGAAGGGAQAVELGRIEELLTQGMWHCSTRTQFIIDVDQQHRRPDLELRFSSDALPEVLVWVEVKHGSEPHTMQLRAYLDAIGEANAFVVLLAPRLDYLRFESAEIPPDVLQATWQTTAGIIRSMSGETVVGQFLIDELLAYLREERLIDLERITPEHLVALSYHAEALEALEQAWQIADEYVHAHWAPHGPEHVGSRYGETWHYYPSHPPDVDTPLSSHEQFSWSIFHDGAQYFKNGRRGVPRVVAGVGQWDDTALPDIGSEGEDQLRNQKFTILVPKRDVWTGRGVRTWRMAYPDEILAGSTLVEQGRAVGEWVVEAFKQLHNILASAES